MSHVFDCARSGTGEGSIIHSPGAGYLSAITPPTAKPPLVEEMEIRVQRAKFCMIDYSITDMGIVCKNVLSHCQTWSEIVQFRPGHNGIAYQGFNLPLTSDPFAVLTKNPGLCYSIVVEVLAVRIRSG